MESLTTGDHYNLRWNSHKNCLVSLLEDHLTNEDLVDVTIFCSGKYIKAHKLILSASSSYFREIFQVHKVDNPLIILNNVKYEYLKYVIDFIYTGEIRVGYNDLEQILLLGSDLKVKGLLNVTEKHIAQTTYAQNNSDCKRKNLSETVGEVKVLKDDKQNQNKPLTEGNSKQFQQNLSSSSIDSAGSSIGGKNTLLVTNQVAKSSVVPKFAISNEFKTKRNEIESSTKIKKRKVTVYKPTKDLPQKLMDPLDGESRDTKLLEEEVKELNCRNVDSTKDTTMKPNQGIVLQVKPVSAFMIFANEWRKRLAVEHPNESNKEISVRLSNMWKNLSDDTRDLFYETASRVYADQKQKFKSVKR